MVLVKKRRTIGPVYEQSPAERISEWLGDNVFKLLAALAVAVAFWVLVDVVVKGMSFIEKGGMENKPDRFTSDDPFVVWTKMIGAPLLAIITAIRRIR